MFTEPNNINTKAGWIEVVCGSMFSGKTEELIRRLKRARIANMKVGIYKPSIDIRYKAASIVSHDENSIDAHPVGEAKSILSTYSSFDVIGIDEAQFFDQHLIGVCQQLANEGKRVIIAGLDMDYTGKPFGPMPELLAIANYVTKLRAMWWDSELFLPHFDEYRPGGIGRKRPLRSPLQKLFQQLTLPIEFIQPIPVLVEKRDFAGIKAATYPVWRDFVHRIHSLCDLPYHGIS
jgi:thymidine kinase